MLLGGGLEAVPRQQIDHPGDAIALIEDLDDELLDFRPVAIIDAGEDVELAALGVDLEQIDPIHPFFTNDLRERLHLARHGSRLEPILEDGSQRRLVYLLLLEHVLLHRLHVALAVGEAARDERQVWVVGQLLDAWRRSQANVHALAAYAIQRGVHLEQVEYRTDRLERENACRRATVPHFESEESNVRADVEDAGLGTELDALLREIVGLEQLGVAEIGFRRVAAHDDHAVGQLARVEILQPTVLFEVEQTGERTGGDVAGSHVRDQPLVAAR